MKKILITILILILLSGCNNNKNQEVVNVLNWSSYIPYEVITDFQKETGIKVNYGTYSSNEELLAKITASKEGTYDLVFPSDYMVKLMISKNLLDMLDKSKINNLDKINPQFLNQNFDDKNEYSIPFLAATSVLCINRDRIKDDIRNYNDLLNPKYRNNIVLLDDQRIVIGMALQALEYNMNETADYVLEKAKNWLIKLNPNVKAFDSDSPKTLLITGEVDIGVIWNAEATIAKQYNDNIEIIYPEDGFAISLDNYTIVKGAKNKDNAYKFIDYILRDNVQKKITEEYPYISTTINNMTLSHDELDYILKNGSYVLNVGQNISKFDKVWAQIK